MARKRTIIGVLGISAICFVATAAHASATPRLKPPAPDPDYLSRADYALLNDIAADVKRKRFDDARSQLALVADPTARSLGQWLYFMGEDPKTDLAAADAFLDTHREWPATTRIQDFLEDQIPNSTPASDVLSFFDTRDPISGDGKIHLARALISTGESEAGEIHLRDAWVNHNFSVSKERQIISQFGDRLSAEDHARRVDRLLWGRQVTNARRTMARLDSNERRKANARVALLLRAANAQQLYRRLSTDEQRDSGVLLAAVRYYRRTGEEQFAISLAKDAPTDPAQLRNPGRWWEERNLLMRWALKEGRFADAYAMAAHHGLDETNSDFSDAEFNAGWIALRFLNNPERAEKHFLALASAVGTPISLSRSYYWLGRAASAQGNEAGAQAYYEQASQHYYSFYGQLAAEQLDAIDANSQFGPVAAATPQEKALFGSRPTVAAMRMLSDLDLEYEFMVFAYHVDDQLEHPGEYVELAKLTNGEGAPHLTVRAGKVAIRRNAFAADVAYPLVFVPDEAATFVSPEIILGLSRQESEFNPRAFSSAGARGMMQLIPSTAQITARKERMRYSRSALLDDPIYNVTLGSAHLSHLIDRFDGSLIMTFAAYNAGANRVSQWVDRYGDPRSPNIDPLDWIELIPFSETRNYVQRVLENTQVYRGRLNNAPIPGRLSADLERGGTRNRTGAISAPPPPLAALSASAGSQIIAPLPERTALRAEQFKLALAEIPGSNGLELPGATNSPPSGVSNNIVDNIDNAGPSASEPPQRTPAQKPTNEASGDNAGSEPAANNISFPTASPDVAPIDNSAEQAPATPEIILEPTAHESEAAIQSPQSPEAMIEMPNSTDREALTPALINIEMGAATSSTIAGQTSPTEASHNDELNDCLMYRDFLARNAEEGTAAEDLNAGMLAEIQSGGSACK